MRYVHSPRARRRFRVGPLMVSGAIALAFAGAFAWSVKAFRASAGAEASYLPLTKGESEGVALASSVAAIPERALSDREAALIDLRDSARVGVARRGQEDGKPYVELLMGPPPIDREAQAYEAWAVRPLPYEYFSLGEMVTNELGEFTARWVGEKDATVDDYTRIVVTLEKKDGNPDPGEQVIKGVFGAD